MRYPRINSYTLMVVATVAAIAMVSCKDKKAAKREKSLIYAAEALTAQCPKIMQNDDTLLNVLYDDGMLVFRYGVSPERLASIDIKVTTDSLKTSIGSSPEMVKITNCLAENDGASRYVFLSQTEKSKDSLQFTIPVEQITKK